MVFTVNGDKNLMRHSKEFNVREVMISRSDCNVTMHQYADWSFSQKTQILHCQNILFAETHIRRKDGFTMLVVT